MSDLAPRDRELVALGAAMGSNCVPCVEYHIPEARKIGLTDAEIQAAIQHADKIRQVPARKTLQAALKLLPTEAAKAETSQTEQPHDKMMAMMSKMMATCGSHGQPAGAPNSTEAKPAATPATNDACGCG